jgi:predicted small metal-binding protein
MNPVDPLPSTESSHFISNYDEPPSEEKMAKQVNCDCGFMVRAQTDDELVQHVQLHSREIHQMDVPRDKALELARPVEATVTI